eukprot:1448496-Prymnesium_polylepis.1
MESSCAAENPGKHVRARRHIGACKHNDGDLVSRSKFAHGTQTPTGGESGICERIRRRFSFSN